MLPNLHLHNYLDPTSSLLSDCSPPPSSFSSSPVVTTATSLATQLLFFAISIVVSYASSSLYLGHKHHHYRSSYFDEHGDNASSSSSPPPPPHPHRSPSSSFITTFFSLLNLDCIYPWIPPSTSPTRNFNELQPLPILVNHALALALALSCLSHGLSFWPSPTPSPFPCLSHHSRHLCLLATRLYLAFVQIPSSHHLSTLQPFHNLSSLPKLYGSIASSPIHIWLPPSSSAFDINLHSPHYPIPSILLYALTNHCRIF